MIWESHDAPHSERRKRFGDAVLDGCRVVVTRERPGELAALLAARGATVVHVPLIRIVEPVDGGMALRRELERLDTFDWLVVTSAPGAERVAAAATAAPSVRLAAVGTTTAKVLAARAGRDPDVVPTVQRADALVDALLVAAPLAQRFLVVQADRADTMLGAALREGGHDVTTVVAYRTELVAPPADVIDGVDALVLASGSAAQAWFDTVGDVAPPIVISIGPTTTRIAEELGLKVTSTAVDHSLDGIVTALERVWGDSSS